MPTVQFFATSLVPRKGAWISDVGFDIQFIFDFKVNGICNVYFKRKFEWENRS
jgi:hypothetical protein